MTINLKGSHVACIDCLEIWVDWHRKVRPFNNPKLPDMRGLPIHGLMGMIDTNANHEEVCKLCKGDLGDDRMIGGDGEIGCDILGWSYHEKCFYGAFGYID